MFGLSGQGALAAPALANISRWYSEHRGRAVGIVSSGQALAGIVWLPVFGYVMLQIGWREMFFWYGVFSLCVMLPLCLIVRHKPPPPKPLAKPSESKASSGQPVIPMSNNSIQYGLSVAIFGCCIAMALPLGHLVSFVTDRGHPIQNAVEVQSVMLLSAFVSRAVLLGLISDRWGGMRALLIFSFAQTIMLTIFTITHSLWALYVVAALFGLGYGGLFPVYTVAIRDHLPIGEIGRRTGVVFFVGAVAMGIGGWLGGYLFDQTGSYTAPFLLGAGFNAANVILVIYMIYRLRDVLPGKLVRV
jgi:MFS family permease